MGHSGKYNVSRCGAIPQQGGELLDISCEARPYHFFGPVGSARSTALSFDTGPTAQHGEFGAHLAVPFVVFDATGI